MKSKVKKILQKALGFDRYLFIFSLFTINTLRWNKKEGDFLYFLSLIPDGGLVLDIGANIGIMSVWLGKQLKKSRILAFEPIPQNVKALKKVIGFYHLQNITIIEKAVGNTNGTVNMVMPVLDDVKMQGLSHVVHESITDFNDGKAYSAPITRLDECTAVQQSELRLTAIKLDVENFEYYVLEGGRETISRHRPIIYTELWENENRNKCFDFIRSLSYTVSVLHNNSLQKFDPEKHHTQNFFFIP